MITHSGGFLTKDKNIPDPNKIYPIKNFENLIYIKPTVKNPNIIVGDFTYYADENFEKQVTHHYDFYNDKLIIGKFYQIAKGVTFIMNGANHQMNAVSTFPFYILEGWKQEIPPLSKMPIKGDTIIGNDVWIGKNSTILPGVKIGNGVIIDANNTVGSDISPYSIAVENKRFDNDLVEILEKLQWWNLEINEINNLIPILTSENLNNTKN